MISISGLYCGAPEASAGLRYRTAADRRPVVVWNVTQRCNLRCAHCYSDSGDAPAAGELTAAEGRALLDDLAHFGVPVILFSGGEPLLRPDLLDLVRHAASRRLRPAVSTNGTLITDEQAERMKDAGVAYAGVSLDGLRETNDRFRSVPGAFDRAVEGIRACRRAGIKVGLRFSMTRRNIADIPGVFDLLEAEEIPRICFYHLVCAGRARRMMNEMLNAAETRRAVDLIVDRAAELHARGRNTEVLTVDNHSDGPYLYLRMMRERRAGAARALDRLRANGGNQSGVGIASVSWDGAVYADQFWRHRSFGNVRERPFSSIWTDRSDSLMAKLKEKARHVTGRCSTCRFLDACGGNLRARAEALTGDLWAPDPACYLTDAEIATQ